MPDIDISFWWEPSRPDVRFPGALVRADADGWTLRLVEVPDPSSGNFSVLKAPGPFPVLLGSTPAGRPVTLFESRVLKSSCVFPASTWSLTLFPEFVIVGSHAASREVLTLESLSVRYSNLDAWADISGFKIDLPDADRTTVIRYQKPERITASLADGISVAVGFASEGPGLSRPQRQVQLTESAWILISTVEPKPFDELYRLAWIFSDLATLSVGEPARLLEMEGSTVDGEIAITDNRPPITSTMKAASQSDVLFTLSGVRSRFDDLVRRWFDGRESMQPLYSLYFSTVRDPGPYLETRFLNMFQALEAFDRRIAQPDAASIEKHAKRVEKVMEIAGNAQTLNSEDRRWIRSCLRHREPGAAERIKHLVGGQEATWLLDDENIELAANIRNFYTHYDEEVEARIPVHRERIYAMHNLYIRLRVLCELLLLHQLGFSNDEARQQIERTGRLMNYLAARPE